ncbi:CIS tube protein [Roseivirga pacifica]
MKLSKLTITGYKDSKFSKRNGDKFVVMINPANYDHNYSVTYSDEESPGKAAKTTKFKSIGPETVSFNFVFDDTGAVERNKENEGKTVAQMIKALKDVVYKYYGEIHEPNYVLLVWGTMIFKSRLESMKVEYQMFKPNGVPLRAKITLSFKGFTDPAQESQVANRSSPDLTHIVTIKEGDTLPLLCDEIYRDSKYYLKVAKANNLVDVRNLKAGTKLIFPPIN